VYEEETRDIAAWYSLELILAETDGSWPFEGPFTKSLNGSVAIITDIVNRLKLVKGLNVVVLGDSRARGTHTPNSDIDIGIYYRSAMISTFPHFRK
jgi:TatD DNase family protein